MVLFLKAYAGRSSVSGYSAQTWIAKLVNEYLHPGSYFCWFSTNFNAMANGDDSNPIWLYWWLDRAVAQGGVNNAKVQQVRANLLLAIDRELRAAGRASEIADATYVVTGAPLQMFTPQVWRINMAAIAGRYTGGHQYPDEYNITDLRAGEFEIVIS